LGFKNYLDDTTFKYKKVKQDVNPEEYEKYVESCGTYKADKKNLKKAFRESIEFPVFLDELNKFVMANTNTKKCRDLKTRQDKELAGSLYNGMLRESKESNKDFYERLKTLELNWSPPAIVFQDQ
jgi:hypothetical protein